MERGSTWAQRRDELLANDINPSFSAAELAQRGVQAANDAPLADKQALIELTTPGESPEYWLGSQNFYVITRDNRSSFYAMSVFQLGEAVKAARAARRGHERDVRALSATARERYAELLDRLGR